MYSILLACKNIRAFWPQSLLISLGLIISMTAVTLIATFSEGLTRQAQQNSQQFGNALHIKSQRAPANILWNNNFIYSPAQPELREADLRSVQNVEGVAAAAPLASFAGEVRRDQQVATHPRIVATTSDLAKIMQLPLSQGEFLRQPTTSRTAVISHATATQLFGDATIGGQITIRGQPYTVIGVLKDNPATTNMVFVPIVFDASTRIEIVAALSDSRATADTTHAIREALQQSHNNAQDFRIITQVEALAASQKIIAKYTAYALWLATITLFIAGVALLCGMYFTVHKRSREISVRKSVGASNVHIFWQFYAEAIVLCVIAGSLGVASGLAIGAVASFYVPVAPALTLPAAGALLALSLCIGGIFGLAPAIIAARKNPTKERL